MLKDTIIPQVREQYQDDDFCFQQDGAPLHFTLDVRTLLDSKFPNRWIGRRGPIEWQPRSRTSFLGGELLRRRFSHAGHALLKTMSHFILETCQEIDANEDLCSLV